MDGGFAPARSFETLAEFKKHFDEYDTIVIDATEVAIERPSDYDEQRDNYSGKKKGVQ